VDLGIVIFYETEIPNMLIFPIMVLRIIQNAGYDNTTKKFAVVRNIPEVEAGGGNFMLCSRGFQITKMLFLVNGELNIRMGNPESDRKNIVVWWVES
jgi:hypothetical protein